MVFCVLPVIGSAQNYLFIEGDTLVTFTLDETRQIAIIFQQGDMYEELYFNELEITAYKDSIIQTQFTQIQFMDSAMVVAVNLAYGLNQQSIDYQKDLVKANKSIKKQKNFKTTSIIINIVLFLLLIL